MTRTKEKPDTLDQVPDPATTRDSMITESEQTSKSKAAKPRTRNYSTVIYPESAPENWQQILADSHVMAIASPLHDKDVNPSGELKKPHRHITVMYDAPKTMEQARALFSTIGGVGCEAVQSIRGQARYDCHLDNPEKAQYDIKDVIEFNGADYQALISLPSDRYGAIREMVAFIELNNIYSFSELFRWCAENNERWFRALCDNSAYIIKEYVSSRLYTHENNLRNKTETWITDPDQARRLLSAPTSEEFTVHKVGWCPGED